MRGGGYHVKRVTKQLQEVSTNSILQLEMCSVRINGERASPAIA